MQNGVKDNKETKPRSDLFMVIGASIGGLIVLGTLVGFTVWILHSKKLVKPDTALAPLVNVSPSQTVTESAADIQKDKQFLRIFQNIDNKTISEHETFAYEYDDYHRTGKISAKEYTAYLERDQKFWDAYIKEISASNPKNPLLIHEKERMLYLFHLTSQRVSYMESAVHFSDNYDLPGLFSTNSGASSQYDLIMNQMVKYGVAVDTNVQVPPELPKK